MRHLRALFVAASCLTLMVSCTMGDENTAADAWALGMAPSDAAGTTEVNNAYASWKSTYVTSSGAGGHLRVQRPENGSDTVSEGIGYGMLLSAYLADKATFDGLWEYAKSHFDARGLMHWQINAGNSVIGWNAATDADEDMALALIVADKKWGGYASDAATLLANILSHEVESGTDVLKPGDVWGGSSQTNPSYFAPAYYKVFATYTGNARWNQVADATYTIIANLNANTGAGTTGLLPDWTTAAGAASPGGFNYTYDACRVPFRLSHDAAWYNDPRAVAQLGKLNTFWAQQGVNNIKDGYTLSGSVIGGNQNAAFTAMAASGALASTDSAFRSAMWTAAVQSWSANYYNATLRTLALLHMAGMMPNPLTLGGGGGGGGGAGGGTTGTSACSPATYEAESMTHTVGGSTSDGWNIWSNGYIAQAHTFTAGATTITVVAKGTSAVGTWPHMVVTAGGATAFEATVSSSSWTSYSFTFTAPAGAAEIRIAFDNDHYANGEDRNLLVDKVTIGCPDGGTGGSGGGTSTDSGSTSTSSTTTTSTSSGTTTSTSSTTTSTSSSTSGGVEPCSGGVVISGGQSGNFNTTGPVCIKIPDNIQGWGCSNFDGRTVQVNDVGTTCGSLPLPSKVDGYYYFEISGGTYPWASVYWW